MRQLLVTLSFESRHDAETFMRQAEKDDTLSIAAGPNRFEPKEATVVMDALDGDDALRRLRVHYPYDYFELVEATSPSYRPVNSPAQ